MSKNPSERNQTPSDIERAGRQQQHEDQGQATHDRNKQPERHRESMGRKQAGQKFVSDEDIVKRTE